jgi:hypothetical protein
MSYLHTPAVLMHSVAQCGALKNHFKVKSSTQLSANRRQCVHYTTQMKLQCLSRWSFGAHSPQKLYSFRRNNIFKSSAASTEPATPAQDTGMPLVYDGVIFDMVKLYLQYYRILLYNIYLDTPQYIKQKISFKKSSLLSLIFLSSLFFPPYRTVRFPSVVSIISSCETPSRSQSATSSPSWKPGQMEKE